MKAVIVFVCFVTLTFAQVGFPPPILGKRSRPDDIRYHLHRPESLRRTSSNAANIDNLVASIVEQIVNNMFPEGTSLRRAYQFGNPMTRPGGVG
uniref:Uncharacterized protein n=1 Tax=Anopheles funestus TaxID=62324 RepID=A0A3F2YXM4_ANOFN